MTQDSPPTTQKDPTPTGGSGGTAWIRLFIGVVFVVMVAGVTSYLLRDRTTTGVVGPAGLVVDYSDSFDRYSGGLDEGRAGDRWIVRRGGWSVAAGAAYVSRPVAGDNVAVVEVGPYVAVRAQVSGLGRCGIIADLDDGGSLSLVRVEKFGVWNLQRQKDGTLESLASVPGSKNNSLPVSIVVEPPIVTAEVGDKSVSVSVPGLEPRGAAGFLAADPDPEGCAFDELVISGDD